MNMKKRIIIALFLITVMFISYSLALTTYFSSDFSDETFSDWDGFTDAEQLTSPVPTGFDYSCNATSSGFGLTKQWDNEQTEFYFSFKVRFANLDLLDTPVIVAQVYGEGSSEYVYMYVGKVNEKDVVMLISQEIGVYANGTKDLQSNIWYDIVVSIEISESATIKLYLDDVLECFTKGDNSDGSYFDYVDFSSGGLGVGYDRQYLADINVMDSYNEQDFWYIKYILAFIVAMIIIGFAIYIKIWGK